MDKIATFADSHPYAFLAILTACLIVGPLCALVASFVAWRRKGKLKASEVALTASEKERQTEHKGRVASEARTADLEVRLAASEAVPQAVAKAEETGAVLATVLPGLLRQAMEEHRAKQRRAPSEEDRRFVDDIRRHADSARMLADTASELLNVPLAPAPPKPGDGDILARPPIAWDPSVPLPAPANP